MTIFNSKQTTLIQHLVASSVNAENVETRTRILLQGLGNMEEQARNFRIIFARSPNGWKFATPQRKQTVKRSYQVAFAIVNAGHTLTNKGETKERADNSTMKKGKEVVEQVETVPATQLQASQAATVKAKNEVDSLKTFAKKTAQEHHKIVAQTEQDAEELNAQLKGQVKQLRERNEVLTVALDRLTHENHTTVKELKELKDSILSSATRKELKEQVNS